MGYPHQSHPRETPVLSKHFGDPAAKTLEGWRARGGYKALAQALHMTPTAIQDVVKTSGLRGRGGAGFPTGLKWSFMKLDDGKPHYLCCNADESEPGTFKDREIMRWTPHALIEGVAIGAYAIGAETAYIYIRGEFSEPIRVMEAALAEARAGGVIGENAMGSGKRIDIWVHTGAGAYICGEETALMNSIEGKRGNPRIKPPFPAVAGLFGQPTTINNVETLAAVPHILNNGAEWYKAMSLSSPKSTGSKLFSVCGNVARPGNYEVVMGFPFQEFLYDLCGGPLPGRRFKALIPGGSSVPVITIEEAEGVLMDYEGFIEKGTMLGSGGVIIFDDAQSMPRQLARLARFYAHESCAQCTQCREGTAWMTKILERIVAGQGTFEDLDTIFDLAESMTGKTICVLSDSCAAPVTSGIKKFRGEFEALITGKRTATVAVGKVADTRMVNLTIEGRTVSVPEGTSILEAAKVAGVLVPHYCYHPGLPVAGVCRMCLVEVEKMPKLAPSCATAAAEGQVVHVFSEKALEARKGVLELLLINHPLDCPICDQAGECELQDYTFQEGRADSRYREPKRFNPVEDFGGDVLFVANRCILCTRCVRFMDDLHEAPVLCVSERGDRAMIARTGDEGLTQPWAANVIDLCPVGALVSKDFLNKARAWELDRTASVCTGCSQGCNTVLETRDNVVVRQKPRANDAVNQFYLCDVGRLDYRWMNRSDRLESPKIRMHDVLSMVDWSIAMQEAARLGEGRRAYVVASPRLSNEALFLLKRIITTTGGEGVVRCATGPEAPLPGVEDLALRADRAPNVTGAERLGFTRRDGDLFAGLREGDLLILADEGLEGVDTAAARRAGAVLAIGTTLPVGVMPHVVLPIANVAEEEGTFTNLRGRVQRFLQAKAAPGLARPSWYALADLATALGTPSDDCHLPSAAFAALAASEPAFRGLSYETLGLRGALLADATVGVA